jgi:hypothetical protein
MANQSDAAQPGAGWLAVLDFLAPERPGEWALAFALIIFAPWWVLSWAVRLVLASAGLL